jgi:hypothetical protein
MTTGPIKIRLSDISTFAVLLVAGTLAACTPMPPPMPTATASRINPNGQYAGSDYCVW